MKIALRIYAVLFGLFAIFTMGHPMDSFSALAIFVKLCNIFAYSTVALGISLYAFDMRFLSSLFWRFSGVFWIAHCCLGAAMYLHKSAAAQQVVNPVSFSVTLLFFAFNYFLIHKLQRSIATA